MLGYNNADAVRGALENFEATTTDAEHRRLVKTIFVCDYPLPSPESNRAELTKLAAEFGWWVAYIPNKGVMENHNVAIHDYCHMQPGDFYITFDPDVRMQQVGWITAMIEALNSDPKFMFCAASRNFHNDAWLNNSEYRRVETLPSGLKIGRWNSLVAWSMGIWRGEFLASRPRNFGQAGKFYGYSEHSDYDRLKANGKDWVSVVDFYDDHLWAPDPEYVEWKQMAAGNVNHDSFDVWLKKRRK